MASLPSRDDQGGSDDAPVVYRVISSLPDFSVENLADAAPASRLDERYHQIPSSLERLRPFAGPESVWPPRGPVRRTW